MHIIATVLVLIFLVFQMALHTQKKKDFWAGLAKKLTPYRLSKKEKFPPGTQCHKVCFLGVETKVDLEKLHGDLGLYLSVTFTHKNKQECFIAFFFRLQFFILSQA